MARPKKYESDAARQAAYRQRNEEKWRKSQELLATRLDKLQQSINDAAKRGDALAIKVNASSTDTLLDNLTDAFNSRG